MANGAAQNGNDQPMLAEETAHEANGASQIGPFDYVPKLGFREYWYPAIEAKKVGRKPVGLKMLGEDLVFFQDKNGEVVALDDWCPHRGARLSFGVIEFPGTITCNYHGYTFDGTGQCLAGFIEGPDSKLAPKLRARSYPTAERHGIVFVWTGETDPVPLEDDLPRELLDDSLTGRRFMRTKDWEANWTEPMAQGIDFHEHYLHRGQNFWRILNLNLPLFRPRIAYLEGVKVVGESDNSVNASAMKMHFGQADYPTLGGKWPRHNWWRKLKPSSPFGLSGQRLVGYDHNVELPSKIRTILGGSIHMRWMVPIDEDGTRVWTFTILRKPTTFLGDFWAAVWYYFQRKPSIIVETNEKEDLFVFKKGRLNLDRPQKLGLLDAGLIYFRRHLARRSRDFKRLGGAHGCLKQPPTRSVAEWRKAIAAGEQELSPKATALGVEAEGARAGDD